MNDETYIGLINPHTKCIGRTYHFVVICHEFLLDILPGLFFASSMIIFSLYTLLLQKHRYHFCIMFRRGINDAGSGQIWEKFCQVGKFISIAMQLYHIQIQIWSPHRPANHLSPRANLTEHVLFDALVGRGGQRQHGDILGKRGQ